VTPVNEIEFLIGLQFPTILENLRDRSVSEVLFYAALVCVTVVGLRLLWFFSVPYANPLLDHLLKTQYLRFPWQQRLVMGWSGMRGAISLAVALSLPLETTVGAFPERDLILFLTVCVIFVTLVLQGITLPVLIVHLGVIDEGHHTRMEELEARLEASRAVLERIEDLGEDGEEISSRTRERVERYKSGLEAGQITEEYQVSSAAWSRWCQELFEAERSAILSLRDEGKISAEVMRRVERDIDLEELRFSS
jgi:NhaP-type Na+/H+ or K+/H+ antiporter